jgi:hypothetical protein
MAGCTNGWRTSSAAAYSGCVMDYTFLVDSYASERLKTLSVWAMFDERRRSPPRRGVWPLSAGTPRIPQGDSPGSGEGRRVAEAGRRVLRYDPQPRVDHGETHRTHGAPSRRADDAAETPGPSGLERIRAVRGHRWAAGERRAHDLCVPEHRGPHRRRIARRGKDGVARPGLPPEHGALGAVVARRRADRSHRDNGSLNAISRTLGLRQAR